MMDSFLATHTFMVQLPPIREIGGRRGPAETPSRKGSVATVSMAFLLLIFWLPREASALEGDFRFGYAGQAQLGFEGTPLAHGVHVSFQVLPAPGRTTAGICAYFERGKGDGAGNPWLVGGGLRLWISLTDTKRLYIGPCAGLTGTANGPPAFGHVAIVVGMTIDVSDSYRIFVEVKPLLGGEYGNGESRTDLSWAAGLVLPFGR